MRSTSCRRERQRRLFGSVRDAFRYAVGARGFAAATAVYAHAKTIEEVQRNRAPDGGLLLGSRAAEVLASGLGLDGQCPAGDSTDRDPGVVAEAAVYRGGSVFSTGTWLGTHRRRLRALVSLAVLSRRSGWLVTRVALSRCAWEPEAELRTGGSVAELKAVVLSERAQCREPRRGMTSPPAGRPRSPPSAAQHHFAFAFSFRVTGLALQHLRPPPLRFPSAAAALLSPPVLPLPLSPRPPGDNVTRAT